jgi:CRISPR-associated protein Cas2
MAKGRLYVFCYDIADDRLRRRMAAALEDKGTRVQGSVFELWLTSAQANRLGRSLAELLERGDSLRVYGITRGNLRMAQAYGRGGPADPGAFYLF